MTFKQEQQNRIADITDADHHTDHFLISPIAKYRLYFATKNKNYSSCGADHDYTTAAAKEKDWQHILKMLQDISIFQTLSSVMDSMMKFVGDILMCLIFGTMLLLIEHAVSNSIFVIRGICNRVLYSIGVICRAIMQGIVQFLLGDEQIEWAEDCIGYLHFVMHHWLARITVLFGGNGWKVDASSYLDRADFAKHIRYEQIELHE